MNRAGVLGERLTAGCCGVGAAAGQGTPQFAGVPCSTSAAVPALPRAGVLRGCGCPRDPLKRLHTTGSRPSGIQRRSHSHFRVKNSMIFFNIERVTSSTLLGSGRDDREQHTSRPLRGSATNPAPRVGSPRRTLEGIGKPFAERRAGRAPATAAWGLHPFGPHALPTWGSCRLPGAWRLPASLVLLVRSGLRLATTCASTSLEVRPGLWSLYRVQAPNRPTVLVEWETAPHLVCRRGGALLV